MMFEGTIWKEGKHWLVEAPLLDVVTQGKTRANALGMLEDAIELLADQTAFAVTVSMHGGGIAVSSPDTARPVALALRRQRLNTGSRWQTSQNA
jgi:hypothetical protein